MLEKIPSGFRKVKGTEVDGNLKMEMTNDQGETVVFVLTPVAAKELLFELMFLGWYPFRGN